MIMMKIILLSLLSISLSANPISKDCTYKGKKLSGKVKIITHAADFKVMFREYAPNLNVWLMTGTLSSCGEWRFVEYAPDFTIQLVEQAPDFTIQFVNSSPGVR
jgi:hypothetical protein